MINLPDIFYLSINVASRKLATESSCVTNYLSHNFIFLFTAMCVDISPLSLIHRLHFSFEEKEEKKFAASKVYF